MDKIYFDILIFILSGILWILLSIIFKDRVKEPRLYTLFPYLLYIASLVMLVYRRFNTTLIILTLTMIAVISILYAYHAFKTPWRLLYTILYPQTINLIIITVLVLESVS